ncbi:MAG: dnaN [Chlamydiia bacterium]|nr:dnaN [Chlamydiia bacterium]
MKFIISRQELSELTSRIQNIVAPKTPIPILSNFLVEAIDNRIILTATDLTVGVRCSGSAKVIEPGSTTIPARRFSNLLRELTASHLEISTNEKEVTSIIADSSTFKMNGLPKSEFPALPELSGAAQLRMKQKELKDMFFRTAFAVSKEDNRYVLTGVFLQIADGAACFVGTDGKRLARASLPIQVEPGFKAECIIPLKAVDEIMKNLNHDEEEATLYIMPDKIAIEASDTIIITKLLSGDYPDVEKVIPQTTNSFVSLHRDELMSLLRQISLFTLDTTHSVRFTFMDGELNLSVNTMDIGEGKVSMPVNYTGPRFDIAFNPMFFLDILRHSKKETVMIGFSDSYNPGMIADGEEKITQGSYPSPLFVLMPMRLNEA